MRSNNIMSDIMCYTIHIMYFFNFGLDGKDDLVCLNLETIILGKVGKMRVHRSIVYDS